MSITIEAIYEAGILKPLAPLPGVADRSKVRVTIEEERLRQTFEALVAQWRRETMALSSSTEKILHPAYQRIIGLGPAILPMVLSELEQRGGHWFWALRALSGENPVPPEDAGQVRKMTELWLEWGQARGLV